jgi:hypothetical protein
MRLLCPFLLWCLCGAIAAVAQDAELSVLQNLPAVGVTVRGLSPDGAKLGLTESALVATVRAMIEPVGVKVIPPPQLERTPSAAVLEITANVSLSGKTSYFFILDLQLREPLKPARAHRTLVTVPAVTWAEQTGGVTAKAETVQAALARLALRFAEEWEQAQRADGA